MFKFICESIKRIPFLQTFSVKTALRFPKELLIKISVFMDVLHDVRHLFFMGSGGERGVGRVFEGST